MVYDKHGRKFTTANDLSYAERLAARLGGRVESNLEGSDSSQSDFLFGSPPNDDSHHDRPIEQ